VKITDHKAHLYVVVSTLLLPPSSSSQIPSSAPYSTKPSAYFDSHSDGTEITIKYFRSQCVWPSLGYGQYRFVAGGADGWILKSSGYM